MAVRQASRSATEYATWRPPPPRVCTATGCESEPRSVRWGPAKLAESWGEGTFCVLIFTRNPITVVNEDRAILIGSLWNEPGEGCRDCIILSNAFFSSVGNVGKCMFYPKILLSKQ